MRVKLVYLPPLIFLTTSITLMWYLFFSLNLLDDSEKRLTGIVTYVGLTFGIFQFWIAEVNNTRRRQFDLKYEAYKEFRQIIDAISETLILEMTGNSSEAHGTVSRLMYLINQFHSSIQMHSDFLFHGLEEKAESIEVRETLKAILVRSDKLKQEIYDVHKNNPERMAMDLVIDIAKMNWHNDTREHLKKLQDCKHTFYKKVRGYF